MKCKWELGDCTCYRHTDGVSEYCLFHRKFKSEKEKKTITNILNGDIEASEYLWNKKENIYDFRGIIFEQDINISNIKINNLNKKASFDFSYSVFNKNVYFDDYKFYSDVLFINTRFNQNVSFENCVFIRNCTFDKSEFLSSKSKSVFYMSKFLGQEFIFKNISNGVKLDGIRFSSNTKFILKNVDYDKKRYIDARNAYRIAKNQSNIIGDYEESGKYYYKERMYNGKMIFPLINDEDKNEFESKATSFFKVLKQKKYHKYIVPKIMDLVSKYIVGYGEKPQNVLFFSFILISIFAYLYMIAGLRFNINVDCAINYHRTIKYSFLDMLSLDFKEFMSDYFQAWYFSIVTFTTVGYGEIIPINHHGQILASIEMFLGVTVIATWTSTVVRKMSR
ncbi:potassium channel family protein [Tepidibacter aestuarii]|uniref:potassium channel family protein n=1 Tax=Tepidibacter aestuarii TaxID=2925782 RepID=UPI0020BD763D|nr:potassium channel family protein [Tepidibacter aestuarii]CAH2214045.1 Pentapeptide repeat-containing protein [Tepidibacter aestuarii]